jgi:uncharacterized protein (DUF2147 family)
MFRRTNVYLISIFTVLTPGVAFADSHDVFGLWQSEARDGYIRIEDCGDGTPCGTLVWADPEKMISDLDIRNKDRELRSRSLVGVPIVWGFERDEKHWSGGKIYNPEDGKTFRSSLKRQSEDTLKVKGCLGPICISNRWTRVPSYQEATSS